jgi:hypothetical protein
MMIKGRKILGVVLSALMLATLIPSAGSLTVIAQPTAGVFVTTDKYSYNIGETVEITLNGSLILSSISHLNFICYMIRDANGNYVKEQLTLDYYCLTAIGFWNGPKTFEWNQTYLVFESHNGSLIDPIYIPNWIPPSWEQAPPGKYYVYASLNGMEISDSVEIEIMQSTIEATIDIDPDTLNLKSKGKWITAYITLPNGYDINNIDLSTVMLDDVLPAEWGDMQGTTLMVKFDRSDVEDLIGTPQEKIELKVAGKLTNGIEFEGSDIIRAIEPQ